MEIYYFILAIIFIAVTISIFFVTNSLSSFFALFVIQLMCACVILSKINEAPENHENTQVEISQSDKNSSSKKQVNYDLELKKIEIEKERLALEKEKLEFEKKKATQSH